MSAEADQRLACTLAGEVWSWRFLRVAGGAFGDFLGGTLLLALTLTPEAWEGVDLGWLQLKLLLRN